MLANRERGDHWTENASSCSGPNGEICFRYWKGHGSEVGINQQRIGDAADVADAAAPVAMKMAIAAARDARLSCGYWAKRMDATSDMMRAYYDGSDGFASLREFARGRRDAFVRLLGRMAEVQP